jgi:hypothetical protein
MNENHHQLTTYRSLAGEGTGGEGTADWRARAHSAKHHYQEAKPFPFVIIDNFLPLEKVMQVADDFPIADEKIWINYIHFNEKKYGLNAWEHIPLSLRNLIDRLQTGEFLETLAILTGIPGLIADPELAGGGLHQMYPGGFLNIHSDFLIHPVKTNFKRRINLILFLSTDWNESYGGDLEFWSKDMRECVTRIQPKFNRCVIFNTDEYSYHGCPEKLRGPQGFSRKSLALYYYTEYTNTPHKKYTDYKARPHDAHKKLPIFLDSKAVGVYSWLKQKLKGNDEMISRILRTIRMR